MCQDKKRRRKTLFDERKSISQETLPPESGRPLLLAVRTTVVKTKRSCSPEEASSGHAKVGLQQLLLKSIKGESAKFSLLSFVGGPDGLVARQISDY